MIIASLTLYIIITFVIQGLILRVFSFFYISNVAVA